MCPPERLLMSRLSGYILDEKQGLHHSCVCWKHAIYVWDLGNTANICRIIRACVAPQTRRYVGAIDAIACFDIRLRSDINYRLTASCRRNAVDSVCIRGIVSRIAGANSSRSVAIRIGPTSRVRSTVCDTVLSIAIWRHKSSLTRTCKRRRWCRKTGANWIGPACGHAIWQQAHRCICTCVCSTVVLTALSRSIIIEWKRSVLTQLGS